MHEKGIIDELKLRWRDLAFLYTGDTDLIEKCRAEIFENYNNADRAYHNLNHVYQLVKQIEQHKSSIVNPEALLFAAFYHDIIYDVTRQDNELQSAALAEKRLTELNADQSVINMAVKAIKQTASHAKTEIFDIDLFLDIDRLILSAGEEDYLQYVRQIRLEYDIFSDKIYNVVRKQLIRKYLSLPEIYYTTIFKKNEQRARQNLEKELMLLGG